MAEKVIVVSLDASSSFATQLVFLLVSSKPNSFIQTGALPRTTRIRRTAAMNLCSTPFFNYKPPQHICCGKRNIVHTE